MGAVPTYASILSEVPSAHVRKEWNYQRTHKRAKVWTITKNENVSNCFANVFLHTKCCIVYELLQSWYIKVACDNFPNLSQELVATNKVVFGEYFRNWFLHKAVWDSSWKAHFSNYIINWVYIKQYVAWASHGFSFLTFTVLEKLLFHHHFLTL